MNNKKVVIVSKTHLDLGFTDYANNIKEKYLKDFIPNAIKLAEEVNSKNKQFVWTTGAWLLVEALKCYKNEDKQRLISALKNGNIIAHAMPFTTHTELLDADLIEYGLSLIDRIDEIRNEKTISAKMTDVPGHTIALVPYLAKKGIKLLHIGVNGASAIPNVPKCFLWKMEESEIVVIYSGDYGGEFKCEFIEDILYFDHTLDNKGVRNAKAIINNFESIKNKYPEYSVEAGGMDYIAEKLWEVKDKLPVVTSEIGDSWIHGVATDPFKVGAFKELSSLKNEWLYNNTLIKNSPEYNELCDSLLCIAEHTWGMDMKCNFADYENYLRNDFERARIKDKVKTKHIFRDFPQNFISWISQLFGKDKNRAYSVIETSWKEQREYVYNAINCLSEKHKAEAILKIENLLPSSFENCLRDFYKSESQENINCTGKLFDSSNFKKLEINKLYYFKDSCFSFNEYGGIKILKNKNDIIIKDNNLPVLQYHSYGQSDYDFWFKNYTRDIKKTALWAYGDFGRPLLKYVDKKFKQGRFNYQLTDIQFFDSENEFIVMAHLKIDEYFVNQLGAPKKMAVIYRYYENTLAINVSFYEKSANRLTESLHYNFMPNCENLIFYKMGHKINPFNVVEYGNRNLSAIEKLAFALNNGIVEVENKHSPLIGLGKGKILQFDNVFEDVKSSGLSYILHNNVWGTNFPLWYEDNASFNFKITYIPNSKN